MQVFSNIKPVARVFAASTALALIFGSAAMAADANAVAERLKAIYAKQGGELNFANVKADGSRIVLEGTTLKLTAESDKTVPIGDVALNDVQDAPDGGFTIGQVVVPDITVTDTEDKKMPPRSRACRCTTFCSIGIGHGTARQHGPLRQSEDRRDCARAARKGWRDRQGHRRLARHVEQGGKDRLHHDRCKHRRDLRQRRQEPACAAWHENFQAAVNMKGQWSPQSGDMSLDQMEIDAVDLGKLNITASLGGYDLAFVEAVQKTQETMARTDTDKDAAGLAILGLAEQLNVKNLAIRFDDASLTNKLLTYYAKKQGSDAKALGSQMKLMVPLMATQLNNPEFAAQLKTASDKYFSDPKSLTISASPDQPVTFASIVATASLDPTKIIQLLKVGVDANN